MQVDDDTWEEAMAHARSGAIEEAKTLLEPFGGFDGAEHSLDRSILHRFCDVERAGVVREVLSEGVREVLDLPDEDGRTPLMIAAWSGSTEIVRMLLEAGCEVDRRDPEGMEDTALGISVARGHGALAKILLDAGADPDLPGWMQLSARDRAKARRDERPDDETARIVLSWCSGSRPK